MNFKKILKWNKRFHKVSSVAGTANAVASSGAFASDLAVFASDLPDHTEFAHQMVEMFKLDKSGTGPLACSLCDRLYIGSLDCPECGGPGVELKEGEFTDSDPFAGDPFAGDPFTR